jgi:hypothetical protein
VQLGQTAQNPACCQEVLTSDGHVVFSLREAQSMSAAITGAVIFVLVVGFGLYLAYKDKHL